MTVGFELGGMATAWTFAWMGAFGAPCLVTTRGRYRSVSGPGEYTPITPGSASACGLMSAALRESHARRV